MCVRLNEFPEFWSRNSQQQQIKEKYKAPNTREISVLAKYQQMIDGLVDEVLMKEILQKI